MRTQSKYLTRSKIPLAVISALISLMTAGCGNVHLNVPATTTSPNSSPSITGTAPSFIIAGSNSRSLVINGTGFIQSSSATFNSIPHPVTFISSQQISIALDSADISIPGNYSLSVANPAPGGGATSIVFPIWQTLTDSTTGMTFSMPDFGKFTKLSVQATGTQGGQVIPQVFSSNSSIPASGFGFDIDPNNQDLTLMQWFEANVDTNGALLASGAYREETLPDGSQAIISGSGSTESYNGAGGLGPLLEVAYKLTPTGQIVGIFTQSDPSLVEQGYMAQSDDLRALELSILTTVHF